MFLPAIALALLASSNAFVLPQLSLRDGRIAGGLPAQITEAPYTVALLLDYWNVGSYAQSCGGAIIKPNVILSVAQCIGATFAIQWRVRAGSSLHNTGGQVNQVQRFTIHPGFSSQLDNDVALFFLRDAFSLSSTVLSIDLPEYGQYINETSIGLLTGWGTIVDQGPQPNQLHKVNLPIVPQEDCITAYAAINPVTQNMFCAGRLDTGGVGACKGDAGGPLVINATVMGLTSWGKGCAEPLYPDVLVRVPNFVGWIEEAIEMDY